MIDLELYPYVPGVSEKFRMIPTMSQDEANLASVVDYDLFYIYLADVMITIPSLAEYVKKQYEVNKFLYYSKAINSPQYNATIMSDGSIEREAMTKRAFGILMATLDDDKLRTEICNLLISIYPSMRKLKKAFSSDLYSKLDKDFFALARNNKWPPESQRGFWFFGAYIVDCYHGLNGNNTRGVVVAKLSMISAVLIGESANRKSFHSTLDKVNVRKFIKTPAYFREFKPLIQDSADIRNAIWVLRKYDEEHYEPDYNSDKRFASIYDYLTDPDKKAEQVRIEICLRNLMDAVALSGKNVENLIDGQEITEEEIALIYKIVSRNYQFEQGDSTKLIDIHPSDYLFTIVVYLIMKVMKSDADFYYKNSAESQFYEMRAAEKENASLKEQLDAKSQTIVALQQQIAVLTTQIDALKAELLKDTKDAARDATKPLLAEISILNGQISALRRKVEEGDLQQRELHRLREFVFEMQQGADIQVENISLNHLIDGKKIYIFGGHINWRTKLKQQYPSLEVLDGHNASFDAQNLIGANMVLLNTSNMSHDLYYKVVDVLRKHSVPFDYLGKYSNPTLLEKEISEVLLRHQFA